MKFIFYLYSYREVWYIEPKRSLCKRVTIFLFTLNCDLASARLDEMMLLKFPGPPQGSSNTLHYNSSNWLPCFLTHWGRDKMAAFSQTTLSNALSWMKMFEFRLKFHWRLFPRVQLTIFQHWFTILEALQHHKLLWSSQLHSVESRDKTIPHYLIHINVIFQPSIRIFSVYDSARSKPMREHVMCLADNLHNHRVKNQHWILANKSKQCISLWRTFIPWAVCHTSFFLFSILFT